MACEIKPKMLNGKQFVLPIFGTPAWICITHNHEIYATIKPKTCIREASAETPRITLDSQSTPKSENQNGNQAKREKGKAITNKSQMVLPPSPSKEASQ